MPSPAPRPPLAEQYPMASKILVTAEEIAARTQKVAEQIAADYKDKNLNDETRPLIVVCVLKGSFMFCADLCRMLAALHVPVKMEFLCVKSYGQGTSTSGEVQLLLDMREQIVGQHVLLVEDIVDSAITLHYLKKLLWNRSPASLKTVVLLDKPERRKMDVDADYVVTQIPNEFVIGYGMDFAERYRCLKDVCVLKPSYYMPKEVEDKERTVSRKSKL